MLAVSEQHGRILPTSREAPPSPGISLMHKSLLLIGLTVWLPSPVLAQQNSGWATLKGRISFGGDPPKAVVLDIERDADVCGNIGLVDESLVVHPENRGLRYVAIWLESKDPVPVHPDFQKPPEKPPVLDNRNCRFEPRMQAIRTNQILHLTNTDPIAHNAAVYLRRNTPFSEVIPQNAPLEKKFAKPETVPTRVDCSIHAWMKAWLIVQDHPYVAITDANGNFELKHVPAGEWKFRFWQERSGYLQTVTQNGQPSPISKGTWTLTLTKDATLDLGELVAASEQFKIGK